MALNLGIGFAPYFLASISSIAKENTPETKLEDFGFLNLLQSQSGKAEVSLNAEKAGHKRSVRVKKMQRLTKDFTDTTLSCDNTNVIPYSESDVDINVTRQVAIHLTDENVAQYQEEASRVIGVGNPTTSILMGLYDRVKVATNAIMQGVNDDLLTLAVAQVGVNRRTGSNAAATINLNLATTTNPLSDGETQMLADFRINGGIGRPQIVGSGLFYNYVLQQAFKTGFQSNGIDTRIAAASVDFYHDLAASSIAGTNQVLVYQPNSLQLVEYMAYEGFKAGQKPGASSFFTMLLPVSGQNKPVAFDVQLRYNDCQTTMTDAYYGTTLTLEKGYNIIISKQCGLWTIPTGAYRATDVLNGNRGSLRYTITNA